MVQKKLPTINSAHGSETRNIINELIKTFNAMGYTYDEALQKAHDVLTEARKTNNKNKDVQEQINVLIAESGTSDAEVLQARVDSSGKTYDVLKDRLDESDTQLAHKAEQSGLEVERERINNLIAHAGETEGNSELLDVRVGADNVIYGTAGEAVRRTLSSFSEEADTELNGLFDVAKDLGYEREISEGIVIKSGTYESDKDITATFAGWASPLYYDNETFDSASVYLITESPNVTIRLYVMDTDFNVLAYTDTIKRNAGSDWVDFKFSASIGSGVIKEDVFYVGVATKNATERLSTADISRSEQDAASVEYGTYYRRLNKVEEWQGASAQPGTSLLIKLKKGSFYVTYKKNNVEISNDNKIILPPKIQAVVGKEVNIYFDNIMSGYHEDYYIDISCPIGVQQNERWTALPIEQGTYSLTISVYDKRNYQEVDKKTTIINVNRNSVGNGVLKTTLFIGSSTTASGLYTKELLNLFNEDVMDISLIGTQGSGENLHEGLGGWRFSRFHTDADSPFVFDGLFDLSQYLLNNEFDTPDYVFIHLGINDIFSSDTDSVLRNRNSDAISHMEGMISKIHDNSPEVKIGIILSYPASDQDAFGNNYGSGQNAWRYKRNAFLALKEMISQLENRENENVYIVPVHANIDTRNNMPTHEVQVNSRNTQKIIRQSNGLHMSPSGYLQFADSVYYWLKSFES